MNVEPLGWAHIPNKVKDGSHGLISKTKEDSAGLVVA